MVAAAAALTSQFVLAATPSPWLQTGTYHDGDGQQREYIIPHSVMKLVHGRIGNVYMLYVRDTFDPPEGDVQTVISNVVINCDNATWGTYNSLLMKANGEPIGFNTPEVNRGGLVWLPKEMKSPAVLSAEYGTMTHVCKN